MPGYACACYACNRVADCGHPNGRGLPMTDAGLVLNGFNRYIQPPSVIIASHHRSLPLVLSLRWRFFFFFPSVRPPRSPSSFRSRVARSSLFSPIHHWLLLSSPSLDLLSTLSRVSYGSASSSRSIQGIQGYPVKRPQNRARARENPRAGRSRRRNGWIMERTNERRIIAGRVLIEEDIYARYAYI